MASSAIQVQNFVGKEVNGFEIMKLIGKPTIIGKHYHVVGQGKFSYVFKAKRATDSLCVALKLIKVQHCSILNPSRSLTWTMRSRETTALRKSSFTR
jgi:type IV secretory pathway ATPase VirB11/archaellum biosynthesis ATPase